MDILRRIFGVQAPPSESNNEKPANLDGPTAPLDSSAIAAKVTTAETLEVLEAEETKEDLGQTAILEDGHTQKLPEMDVAESRTSGKNLIYGQKSDVGQVRDNNQDSMLSSVTSIASTEEQPEFGLFVIADGMGGHTDGEKASALAARAVGKHTAAEILMPMLKREDSNSDRPTVAEVLREAIQEANRTVSADVPDGGTTLTIAAIIGDLAYIAHVGDSRAYLITQDGIEQLTRDHSLVQRLIELDQLTKEEALEHNQRNVLYRAIGQNENIDVDAITRRLTPGSRLLLCSDGLWNMIPDEEIRNTVLSSPSPQAACDTLVKLANARGGSDNISVILVKIPD